MQSAHTPNHKGRPSADHEELDKQFGYITADHFIAGDELDRSIEGDKAGIVIKCRTSKWLDLYATSGKCTADAEAAFADFEGPWKTVQYFYSDDAPELLAAAKGRGWIQGTATPGRPETNGAAENAVRQVLEGIRTTLDHAGFSPKWWPYAGKHFCLSSNISKTSDGDCACDIRHPNALFTGKRLPFGCLIDFKPSPVKGKVVSKFEPRSVPGLFIGWVLQPGGKFKGDYIVISLEDMNVLLAKPKNARIFVQRVKEIYHNEDEGFIFPLKTQYDQDRRTINVSKPTETKSTVETKADDWLLDDRGDADAAADANPEPGQTDVEEIQAKTPEPEQDKPKDAVVIVNPLADTRNPRKYTGSKRPPHIWPEAWQMLSKKKKDEEIAKYLKTLESGKPAMPSIQNYGDVEEV
jgi:hypothetical protein